MTSPSQAAVDGDSLTLEPEGKSGTPGDKGAADLAGRTPRQLAWLRFKRDRTGIVCAIIVAFFLVVAVAAPLITKLYGQNAFDLYGQDDGLLDSYGLPIAPNGGISSTHWFGIEPALGRDVFALLLYGIRNSLAIATAVTLISVVTGVLFGLAQGYLGGKTDYFMGRFSDFMLSFPSQLFFIAFSPVAISLFVGVGDPEGWWVRPLVLISVQFLLGWMSIGRLVRAQVLSLREREFVEAARISGASSWRIIRKELLPNIWSTILVQSTLLLPVFVTTEAGLSFLGVGLLDPTPDWGLMFQTGATYYSSDITFMFFPGIAMVIFVIAFNLLGDSVRDALDPKTLR
ncbi:ABC transporter permease [Streptomyces sp. NPDC051976]|uniref:ABC transporter permease n=1 Tax=Streptomyces sp. NPDC051976 TaxID=3154947 RepID=UPI0034278BEC